METPIPTQVKKLDLSKFKPSDIVEHLGYLYDTVIEMRPKTILELGVRGGESTRAFVEAIKDLELEGLAPRLISVDIMDCRGACNYPNWIFINGDDRAFQFMSPIDILFIDTSHEYAHTIQELNIYAGAVVPYGKIILHDTEIKEVYEAIQYFLAHTNMRFKFENKENCNGLGTLTKSG